MGGPPAQVCGGSSSEERDLPRWPSKAVSRLQRSQWLPLTVGGPPARGTGETGVQPQRPGQGPSGVLALHPRCFWQQLRIRPASAGWPAPLLF